MKIDEIKIAPPWAVTPEKVEMALKTVVEVARPKKVFLFGSYVNPRAGGSTPNDLDVLVVVNDSVEKEYAESARIRSAIKEWMSFDIVVVKQSVFEKFARVPGYIYKDVLQSGRLVYDAG